MAVGTPYAAASGGAGIGSATVAGQFTHAVSSGDYLLAFATCNSGGTASPFSSLSDPVNGNWTAAGAAVKAGLGWIQWYYVSSSGALTTSQSVTLTITGTGSSKSVHVTGCTGLQAGPPDIVSTGTFGSSAAPSNTAGPFTSANELVVAGLASFAGGGAASWSAPFTVLNSPLQAGTGQWGTTAYDIISSASAVTASAAVSSGGAYIMQVVSVPAAGAVGQDEAAASTDSFAGAPTSGAPYVVGQGNTASGSNSFALATTGPSGSGDGLAAWVTSASTGAPPAGVSDPVNGAWQPAGAQASDGSHVGQWYIRPGAAALSTGTVITAQFAGTAGNKTMSVFGSAGLSAAPLDQTPPATAGNDGSPAITSGGLLVPGELLLAGLVNQYAGGAPAWSGFAQIGSAQHYGTGMYASAGWEVTSLQAPQTASAAIVSSQWAMSMITLMPAGFTAPDDTASAADAFAVTSGGATLIYLPGSTADPVKDQAGGTITDQAGNAITSQGGGVGHPDPAAAAEQFTAGIGPHPADAAAGTDVFAVGITKKLRDFAAARDRGAASGTATIIFHPPAAAPTGPPEVAVQVVQEVPPAVPPFIPATLPRLYLQNILTGEWVHRDVQGQVNPSVTWQLNAPGSYSVTLAPPRPDMLTGSGNPKLRLWQTAAYLEQADTIRWGGILTAMNAQGPELALQFTEFTGYPNGMIYEGANLSLTKWDALDAVRYLWGWLQSQPDSDLGMVLDKDMSGVLLGDTPQFSVTTILSEAAQEGSKVIHVVPLPAGSGGSGNWPPKTPLQVGGDHAVVKTATRDTITLESGLFSYQPAGSVVAVYSKPSPYTLAWYNSTDIGSEISSIQSEAVFDFREVHSWGDAGKSTVTHQLRFGVPRSGSRRSSLRFAEGENVIAPVQCSQDGTKTGNDVIGIGAGSGSAMVRSAAALRNGTLRRSLVYQNQAVDRPDRLGILVQKTLTSVLNPDSVAQITVMDHPNARFGTFSTGDDIPVTLCSGWRNTVIWSRILAVSQVPTTNLMTLSLARSDSFAYIPATGQAGTI